ncbi:MAG: hypothetical protein JXJ17_08550 [Anaerolineae bacterium]|nr:hypothetical protein [Anaerolineae bacterium]
MNPKNRRSRRLAVIAGLILAALLAVQIVYACEPCPEVLTFEETVAEADVIIIGERVGLGPSTGDGPDWITVKVYEVLKGSVSENRIRINSWDGMCPYGIVVEDGLYVMILDEYSGGYDSVHWGCGVKTFPVESEMVMMGDGPVPVDDFVQMLPDGKREIIAPLDDAGRSFGLLETSVIAGAVGLCLAVSAVVVVGVMIVVSRRKKRAKSE